MGAPHCERPTAAPSLTRFVCILLLFVGSGCAALIYEIVWFQLLELVVGSSAISIGMLLATFMGGLCLGSMLLSSVVPRTWHPLRVYAGLELVIGVFGLLVLYGIDYLSAWYLISSANGRWELVIRGFLCAACLFPPTIFMGATLPAIARWVEATPRATSWLGFFYAGNTLGAVVGCLGAGFYLLRVHNLEIATYTAVVINLGVALAAWLLSLQISFRPANALPGMAAETSRVWNGVVYFTLGLSGFCALGAEVVWTRLMSLLLGGSTYTLSLILAVFLTGIGLGSSLASFVVHKLSSPRLAFGYCQAALALATAWCAAMIAQGFPYFPLGSTFYNSLAANISLDLIRVGVATLPAACLWGASFPLALATLKSTSHDQAQRVGRLYAANTLGAIVGALLLSLWLVPRVGTKHSQQLLILVSAANAFLMWSPGVVSNFFSKPIDGSARTPRRVLPVVGLASFLGLAAILCVTVAEMPFKLFAFGRLAIATPDPVKELYRGEGINSMVAVSETSNGMRCFHVSGKCEASTALEDMRMLHMLGNLPALLHRKPQSALVVGFGAGVTAGLLLPHLDMQRIVICEIEPLIPKFVGPHFKNHNMDVANFPCVQIVYDDARHFVTSTSEKFDIITSDPIHPWVKGAATLYTQEYLEQVRDHLAPGGIATQWVPLYESNTETVRSMIATFFKVFPHGSVWSNAKRGVTYDIVLLGTKEPLRIDLEAIEERMAGHDHRIVQQTLNYVDYQDVLDLLATFAVEASELQPWLQDAQINRDRNLRLQYLAGTTRHSGDYKKVHDQIMLRQRFPTPLFFGSDERLQELKRRIDRTARAVDAQTLVLD